MFVVGEKLVLFFVLKHAAHTQHTNDVALRFILFFMDIIIIIIIFIYLFIFLVFIDVFGFSVSWILHCVTT